MKRTYSLKSCSLCPYFSSRKWNLERHYEKIHRQNIDLSEKSGNYNFRNKQKKSTDNDNHYNTGSSDLGVTWEDIHEPAKIQGSVANSNQTFDRLNFFERKITSSDFIS